MQSHNNFSAKRQDGHLLLTFAEIRDEPSCKIDFVSDIEEEKTDDELQWSDEEEDEFASSRKAPFSFPINMCPTRDAFSFP